ncbi:uncharacterized protein LOC115452969 [Manduca sexta]|uniref:uncharacterized protein LOC115452969 n=1 Tax=Manduca sexta TaxID=7130 RepID=UPI0011837D50|nr:uncharacterized protein LOC115452969 [Manduca sexta]
MLVVLCVCLFVAVQGHSQPVNDADMETALMPQELNPAFVSRKDEPWRAVMPVTRRRRFTELSSNTSVAEQVKRYSRIVACVVLAMSALVEIVLYFIEFYYES